MESDQPHSMLAFKANNHLQHRFEVTADYEGNNQFWQDANEITVELR